MSNPINQKTMTNNQIAPATANANETACHLYFIEKLQCEGREGYTYNFYWDDAQNMIVQIHVGGYPDYAPSYVKPQPPSLPLNDEIKAKIEDYRRREVERKVDDMIVKWQEAIVEHDNAKLPQVIGQVVEVLKGKKKGFVGTIFWTGADKYGKGNYSRYSYGSARQAALVALVNDWSNYNLNTNKLYDRIGVKNEQGEVVFVGREQAKVLEGFIGGQVPSRDTLRNKVKSHEANYRAFLKW